MVNLFSQSTRRIENEELLSLLASLIPVQKSLQTDGWLNDQHFFAVFYPYLSIFGNFKRLNSHFYVLPPVTDNLVNQHLQEFIAYHKQNNISQTATLLIPVSNNYHWRLKKIEVKGNGQWLLKETYDPPGNGYCGDSVIREIFRELKVDNAITQGKFENFKQTRQTIMHMVREAIRQISPLFFAQQNMGSPKPAQLRESITDEKSKLFKRAERKVTNSLESKKKSKVEIEVDKSKQNDPASAEIKKSDNTSHPAVIANTQPTIVESREKQQQSVDEKLATELQKIYLQNRLISDDEAMQKAAAVLKSEPAINKVELSDAETQVLQQEINKGNQLLQDRQVAVKLQASLAREKIEKQINKDYKLAFELQKQFDSERENASSTLAQQKGNKSVNLSAKFFYSFSSCARESSEKKVVGLRAVH